MTYRRLGIREFGEHLLTTNDLDPVYVALVENKERWATEKLDRWLIAYWCFYDCGVASWLSEKEGRNFWTHMMTAAINEDPAPACGRWPRGRERRHFRGKLAINACVDLEHRYGAVPESMVREIVQGAPSYEAVSTIVQRHRGFGPWIGFKVADMIDRILGVHVDFTEASVFMFKDPVRAAEMFFMDQMMTHTPTDDGASELAVHFKIKKEHHADVIGGVVDHLTGVFAPRFKAPPLYDRPVGLQEVETILCKWKSHMNGHYPLGNDITEIRAGVQPWAENCQTACEFLEKMPNE